MPRTYTPRPAWVDKVDVGSVLLTKTGDMRVIRKVVRGNNWRYPIFTFAIRRCSWTKRPTTVYGWGELVRAGYTALGPRVELNSRADKKFARNIDSRAPRTMFCWDVVGGQLP